MKIIKNGGHRLFEKDPQTVAVVSEMLLDLEKNGMDAVRKYSRKFDEWNPASFELGATQVAQAIGRLDAQAIAAASLWLFIPARRSGQPVEAAATLQFMFRLE